MSLPILRLPALREIETRHAAAEPPLMERAGAAAAGIALAMTSGKILVVAGPGNNGGDAFVVARLLKEAGRNPVELSTRGDCIGEYPEGKFDLIVDGLFGIGLTRAIEGIYAGWIARMNASGTPILALDVPSGLDAMTGRPIGAGGPVVRATRTATFIALKPGLLTGDGPDLCGTIDVCDLGLDVPPDGQRIDLDLFRNCLRPRGRDTHKGSFGSVAILGGAPGMAGAALLAGRAALQLGAGRVYVGMLERLAVDVDQLELMLRDPTDALAQATVAAIGPGLGQSPEAAALLEKALACTLPLVIDADGLNLLANHPGLAGKLAVRPEPTLLTPHPAEAARLLGIATEAVQADRLAAALRLAERTRAYVALKGCGTVVVAPGGRWFINTTGNPGLASAGSGDVLTGLLAALLAQHWPPLEALLGAVHLHGAAADACVAAGRGPVGLTASEVSLAARSLLNDWIDA
jgi:hydroxyethylthiazole kinase-like uncharacterized protein yjeF